ncbi:MAG: hypothetical protein ABH821_04375 [archaeon]
MSESLVAFLGIGKGTWGHVARLIDSKEWNNLILITNEWGKENFKASKEANFIVVESRQGFDALKQAIQDSLPEDLGEVSLSLVSGNGREHTAIIAALKDKKQDFKLVMLTKDGVKYY